MHLASPMAGKGLSGSRIAVLISAPEGAMVPLRAQQRSSGPAIAGLGLSKKEDLPNEGVCCFIRRLQGETGKRGPMGGVRKSAETRLRDRLSPLAKRRVGYRGAQ